MALHEHEHVLLLEHLYGLLDEPEASRIRDLVSNDPVWREAFTEAQRTQDLFGRAAQIDVTVPEFAAPGIQTPSTPVTLASEAPTIAFTPVVRRRNWAQYISVAVAACVLIGVGILMAVYQNGLQYRETQLSQIDDQLKTIDNQIAQLHEEQKEQSVRIPEQVAKRFVHLNASGPAEYRPDAPLPVRVRIADARGQTLPGRVRAILKSGEKEVARKELESDGDAVVELPAGLQIASAKAELIVEADTDRGSAKASELISVGQPGYTTHLAINKSKLQTGEILFFRSLTLDRFSMKPAAKSVPLNYALVNPQGKTVSQLRGAAAEGGIGGGEFSLTKDLESGAYTLRVSGEKGEQLATRGLEIFRPESPRVVMDRPQYRPGDQAKADFQATEFRSQRGVMNLMPLNEAESRNGAAAPGGLQLPIEFDRDGRAKMQFQMPSFEGAALLRADIGNRKGAVQQVLPIVSYKLYVDFFPESGKLLAGVPNRVYYRVRTSLGEPVAPEGHVILLSSKDVVFDSEREQGMGVFTFTPKVGETYTLRVTSPQGTYETKNALANLVIERTGIGMHVPNAIANEGEEVDVVLQNSGYDRRLLLVATCRDRVVAQQFVDVPRTGAKVKLPLVEGTRGVVRTTLYTTEADKLERVAERLTYRIPTQRLELTAEMDKKIYHPGEHVKLKLRAKDESARPAAGWFGSLVVDENELGPADQVLACLESYFYLFAELGAPLGIEQTLLNFADGAETREALDLYLGTRNWRASDAPEAAAALARADAKNMVRDRMALAECRAESTPVLFSKENTDRHHLAAELIVKAKHDLEARIAHERLVLEQDREAAEQSYNQAASVLADFRNLPAWYVNLAVAIVTVVAFFAGCLLLLAGLVLVLFRRGSTTAFACACASLFVCLVLYGTASWLPHIDTTIAKAGTAPEWGDVADGAPPKLYAWVGPELPVGRFSGAELATAAPPVAAANVDANRGNQVLDMLARRSVASGFGGAGQGQNLTELGKQAQTQPSAAKKTRFDGNVSEQKRDVALGAVGGGNAPPGTYGNTTDPRHAGKDAFAEKQLKQLAEARDYTHRLQQNAQDLEDTVLWKPFINAPKGEADLSFDLSQRQTNYRIITYGNDASGRLGFNQQTLIVQPK